MLTPAEQWSSCWGQVARFDEVSQINFFYQAVNGAEAGRFDFGQHMRQTCERKSFTQNRRPF
jgi:hypothetical protein